MERWSFLLLAAFALPVHAETPASAPTIGGMTAESVSNKEKPQRTAVEIRRIDEIVKRLEKFRSEARASNDVVKLNCVNEKLTQARGLLRVASEADAAMQDALTRGDDEISNHEFTKISRALAKVEQLRAESESCVGELAVYNGDTVVTVEGEKNNGDPTQLPAPDAMPARPMPASNFE